MLIKDVHIDYHRNGVCGNGFYVATFKWMDDDINPPRERHMVATIFHDQGNCAVFDIDELVKDNISFANGNSWRGDHFEPELREKIKQIEDKHHAEVERILKERT